MAPVIRLLPTASIVAIIALCGAPVLLRSDPASRSSGSIDRDFPPLPPKDYSPARVGARQPELRLPFPGSATARSIPEGRATVSVAIGRDGKVEDLLIISYSDEAFAKALQEEIPHVEFEPAMLMGRPIPGRVNVTYDFKTPALGMNAMDLAGRIGSNMEGVKDVYVAHPETDLDSPLEFTRVVFPSLPKNYDRKSGEEIRAYVTFYIDETGQARIPNIESSPSPRLVRGALAAVARWHFQPPKVGGKPALIFTGRPVRFLTEEGMAPQAERQAADEPAGHS